MPEPSVLNDELDVEEISKDSYETIETVADEYDELPETEAESDEEYTTE